ncbi:Type IV prepilin peptidase TadV/CpaA [Rhodovulum sp. P5]|uniref:prepilin peptidase n=1 Tax=Rhodovulum sp. P5 TaxID=1564506 RepID=UPI0009C25293|nr:prepilin peptidase [Rhodovulum sp. P5]ARE41379.1 Type IV prepilin peptidase TadV/CpaA [Rhodovulum sp. P5]
MALSANDALWFLPFVLPIAIWVAWSDMKYMKIPNSAVVALVVVYAAVGLIALPIDVWAWRWLHLVLVLGIGFVASTIGLIGAGDAKFAAAMAPFLAADESGRFLMLFAVVLVAAFITHRGIRRLAPVRRALPDWASWTDRDFPMGLALAGALIFYLVLRASDGVMAIRM